MLSHLGSSSVRGTHSSFFPKTESQVAQAGLAGCVAEDDLEPLILLPLPLESSN